jgi:hypothetical protein
VKALLVAVFTVMVAGCTTTPATEYPVKAYVTDMDASITEPPAPFDKKPAGGEGDIVLMVAHMRGALPLTFDFSLLDDKASHAVWQGETIEQGMSILFGEPTREVVIKACRVSMLRMPASTYTIVARIDEEEAVEARQQVDLRSGERQIWTVAFSPLGTVMQRADKE